MSETELPLLDLDALVKPVARVKIDGKIYPVLPITGNAYSLFMQIRDGAAAKVKQNGKTNGEQTGVDYLVAARNIVREVVPTLPKDRETRMGISQLTGIIGASTGMVETVQRVVAGHEGKGRGPATPRRRPGR